MLTLYQAEWCVNCHRVRQLLTELCLTYTCVNVPAPGTPRAELEEISGQSEIPVLVDGGSVLTGTDAILKHLREHYPARECTPEHHEIGEFRYLKLCEGSTIEVLERIRELLAAHRLWIVSETRLRLGREGDYILLQAASTAVWKQVVASDPATGGAVTLHIGIWPFRGGSAVSIEDPVAGAWLAGAPDTVQTARRVRPRIRKIIQAL